MNFLKKAFATLVALIIGLSSFLMAQSPGKIGGRVIDKKSGEELIGVAVMIQGTSQGSATDISGDFLIDNVAPGTYTLIFTYVSYQKKSIANIAVKAGQLTTVNITMEEATEELTEVVIQAEMRKESLNSLLIQQKNAVSIGNGISAETIKQSPDNNTGEVMKRISGATIQQGRFAIIRGLNDRYNAAMINGSPLPSTEPERRAFSFDLIPANMLDQLIIVKTATPDLPGDFAGGVIQIITKETPDMPFFNVQLGAGFNFLTTGKEFKSYQGGKTDWLGFDDGTRKLPDNFPSSQDLRTGTSFQRAEREVEAAKMVNNNYAILGNTALPNLSFQVSGGKSYNLGKSQQQKLGVIFALNYSNYRAFQPVNRTWYDNTQIPQFDYDDSTYEQTSRIGGLLNFAYKINNRNKIAFKNIVNQNSEDITTLRVGQAQAEGLYRQGYSYFFTQNTMIVSQLNGEHYLEGSNLKINWEAANGFINRQMPDYRNADYTGSSPENLDLGVQAFANEQSARLFTDLRENVKSIGASVSIPVNIFVKTSLKVGGSFQDKNRTFDARMLGFARARSANFSTRLLELPIDQVFAFENMFVNNDSSGFKLQDITNPTHKYNAQASLTAAYFMFDNKLSERWKVIWGVRYESYRQQIQSAKRDNEPVDINTPFNDFLPSINLVYSINTKSNLRASASRTVSRPELRELAPFTFYDFNSSASLEGNENLQRATIDNFDLRYETYPGDGQVFTFAVFYKNFKDPIELLLANDITLGVIRRSFYNLPSAKSLGAEVDFRYNLAKRWVAFGNLSIIESIVNLEGNLNTWNSKRPMQGQSPYIVNVGLIYKIPEADLSVSLLYNIYGDRIYNVGNSSFPDLYEKSRSLLDFQATKLFMKKKMEVKVAFLDILARDLIFYMDFDRNERFSGDELDRSIFRFKMPRILNFSLGYRLK